MDREEIRMTIPYLEEMKERYIEGESYMRHPLPEYYAIEAAIRGLDELSRLEDAKKRIEEQKSEVCLDDGDRYWYEQGIDDALQILNETEKNKEQEEIEL